MEDDLTLLMVPPFHFHIAKSGQNTKTPFFKQAISFGIKNYERPKM